jgi:enoyl-CoA hydratase/carnithine racemase
VSRSVSGEWRCLRVEIDGDVGRVVLNRPSVRNALDGVTAIELADAIDLLAHRTGAILIEGAGDHFCAGADLRHVAPLRQDPPALAEFIDRLNGALLAMESAPVPVVAAVQGYALAGGFELMQACDIVIVADNAIVGDQHVNYGLLPGGGGSQRLPRLVGRQRALSLLLTGGRLDAAEVVAWGLALRAVPADRLHDEALALARRMASLSPACLQRVKELVTEGETLSLRDALALERRVFLEYATGHADFAEGLAAFAERRAPVFTKRAEAPPRR